MGEKVQTAEAQEEGTGTFLFLPPHSPFSHILFLVLQYMYRWHAIDKKITLSDSIVTEPLFFT
jgi:hypothetical protein